MLPPMPYECADCHEIKDYTREFYAGSRVCRDCQRKAATEWRLKHLPPYPSRYI